MTCKNCIHYCVCIYPATEGIISLTGCSRFKDKEKTMALPCKLGDTVYLIFEDDKNETGYCIQNDIVQGFEIYDDGIYIIVSSSKHHGAMIANPLFGYSAFLTEEEAEKKIIELVEADNK